MWSCSTYLVLLPAVINFQTAQVQGNFCLCVMCSHKGCPWREVISLCFFFSTHKMQKTSTSSVNSGRVQGHFACPASAPHSMVITRVSLLPRGPHIPGTTTEQLGHVRSRGWDLERPTPEDIRPQRLSHVRPASHSLVQRNGPYFQLGWSQATWGWNEPIFTPSLRVFPKHRLASVSRWRIYYTLPKFICERESSVHLAL